MEFGTKILIKSIVFKHRVNSHQNTMSYSDNSSFSTTTSYQTMVKAREVAPFTRTASTNTERSQGFPRPVLPLRYFPALSLFPGHILAHEPDDEHSGNANLIMTGFNNNLFGCSLANTGYCIYLFQNLFMRLQPLSNIDIQLLIFLSENQDAPVQLLSIDAGEVHLPLQGILKTFRLLRNLPLAIAANSFGSSTPLIMACNISLPDTPTMSLTTPLNLILAPSSIFWIRLIIRLCFRIRIRR